jgi:RNA polymerase sigma factor (sigma-70 family)
MTEPRERFTVYIVDDDASVRDALALLLSLRGYRTALFASAEDFLRVWGPDWTGCLVVDIKMPGMSGLALQAELAQRAVRLPVVIITAHGSVASARDAFRLDAVDFLEKPFDDDALVAAIEGAFAREDARLARREQTGRREALLARLSDREREILQLLANGVHNRKIGEQLGISPRTVEVHKAHIMSKLETRNLAELIRLVCVEPRE